MWTKNFETLVNAAAFVNPYWLHATYSSGTDEVGYHEETPFSIKDTNGIIQNTYIGAGGNFNSALISGTIIQEKNVDGKNIKYIAGVNPRVWYVRGLLSAGEISVSNCMNLCFGSGTSSESRDDYTIDSIGGITSVGTVQVGAILNEQNNNYDLTISSAIQCPNACTINEIGIHQMVHKYKHGATPPSTATNNAWCNVLLYRKKLDTPIVLQPNEPATVTFQISLPRITLA